MTVSVVDPRYPAILPSLMEPISIDVTTDPLDMTITILYANGAWEVAYQDGVFSAVYEGSTRSTTHFEIIRKGGWFPGRSFVVKVKETSPGSITPPPGPIGQGFKWELLYGVNLYTLPNQTLAPGSAVIDGKTWWVKGTLPPSVGTLSVKVQGGSGILFEGNSTQTESNTVQAPNKQLRLFMPLAANLPNYNPAAPLMVLYSPGTMSQAVACSLYVGLIDDTADAVYPTQAALDSRAGTIRSGSGATHTPYPTNTQVYYSSPIHDYTDDSVGTMIINKNMYSTVVYPTAGFINPYDTGMYGGVTDPPGTPVGVPGMGRGQRFLGATNPANRGLSISMKSTTNTFTISVARIKIYQPKGA